MSTEALALARPTARPRPRRPSYRLAASVALAGLLGHGVAPAAQGRATYLYTLASFSGQLPYDHVQVTTDAERNEVYVISDNLVKVFNPHGMEVFSFGEDLDLGALLDIAVDAKGDVLLLSYKDARPLVTRCDFRGRPVSPIAVRNIPEGVTFEPNRLTVRNGLLYFVSLGSGRLVVTDETGEYRDHVDLLSKMDGEEDKTVEAAMFGFTVDADGSFYFTVPVLFRVFKYSADKTLTSFGRGGSAPGRFGVVSGVAVDGRGNILVVDKLKCVVMIFNREFNFLGEFGYRGDKPENLVVPDDIAVDQRNHIYVTQGRRRGISVFALD